jgi:hypothetical protein
MVVESSRPILHVAREIGVNETTLGYWVRAYRERHAGEHPVLDLPERARQVRAGQRLFERPGFARAASLAEPAGSAVEFEARCNALCDVFSMLAVPKTGKAEGSLNLLKADLTQRMTDPESRERATNAVATLQQVVKLRRGQAHAAAAQHSRQAAIRLGVPLAGDWAESWDRVRHITIEAIYALIGELNAVGT